MQVVTAWYFYSYSAPCRGRFRAYPEKGMSAIAASCYDHGAASFCAPMKYGGKLMEQRKLTLVREYDNEGDHFTVYICECGKILRYKNCLSPPPKCCEACTKNPSFVPIKKLKGILSGMKRRCYNQKAPEYQYYGGRGIKICHSWLFDFGLFQSWAVSHGYKDGLSIERIDVNGNYCPENCTWIPRSEQPKNTRRSSKNRFLILDGVQKTELEWCNSYGISYQLFKARKSRGWSDYDALTKPPDYTSESWKRLKRYIDSH